MRLLRLLTALWALGALLPVLAAAAPAGGDVAALQSQIAGQVEAGFDHPAAALGALDSLMTSGPLGPGRERMVLLGRGLVAASTGQRAALAGALAALSHLPADPLASADAELIRATQADLQGDLDATVKSATAALDTYRRVCPAAPGCDYRSSWRALQMLARQELRRGQTNAAVEDSQTAVEIATQAHDRACEALARGQLGSALNLAGESARAQQAIALSQEAARASGSLVVQARVLMFATRIADQRGDLELAGRLTRSARALALRADAPRTVAIQDVNLTDIEVKTGHPREAIALARSALPLLHSYGDQRGEQVLLHNVALARIALGEGVAAHKALEELLAGYHRSGALGAEAETMREFADALAAAGDLRGALDLFHRERKLSDEIMAANRDATLAQLRAHYDREAQQRQLTQLERENALISVQLENRVANQRVWIGSGLLLVLAMALLGLLYRRVRELNRRLAVNQDFLREQSERDPLTGLGNRRRLYQSGSGGSASFRGALLLIDVDHFKRINDGHGHGSGDQVLVELARRLSELVRAEDLVLRWGGEEFLIFMPEATPGLSHELAERVLQGIGSQVIALSDHALRVTVSVGYASFPLPPQHHPLSLERAINLADMALFTAKREGRNRAIGIEAIDAATPGDLEVAEADFDRALQEGRVSLRRLAGPPTPLSVVGASAA